MHVELITPVAKLHGKLTGKAPFYFKTVNGKTYVQRCPNRSLKPPTAAQTAAKARFAKVAAAVRAILTDPEQKARLKAEYKAQTKIGSLFGYAMHKLNDQYDADGNKIGE